MLVLLPVDKLSEVYCSGNDVLSWLFLD
jgi:hypothetical protein